MSGISGSHQPRRKHDSAVPLSGAAREDSILLDVDWAKREVFERTLVLATAAHELKTPIAVIAGYADLLLGGHLGELSSQQRAVLYEIQQNATRLQLFTSSFLNFSAIEAGQLQIARESGSVNEIVSSSVARWLPLFRSHGVELSFLPANDLPSVFFDHVKFEHVISNLLDNALKFTPAGGEVAVSSRGYWWERRYGNPTMPAEKERRASATRSAINCVRIDVTDTGSGIAPEHHEEIFKEFLQLDHSPQSHGVGLGLALAKRLIEAHAGRIWVESDRGRGSTFSLLLPLI